MTLNTIQAQVREFHETFGHPVAKEPSLITADRFTLRYRLIKEELGEYLDACFDQDLIEVADALGDLLYVVMGAALEHGVDVEPIVAEIHRSNMTKLGADGKPIYADSGKILKGPGYTPPSIAPLLLAQGVL